MSKIAEQRALKAYPIDIIPDDDTMGFTSSDRNEVIRLGYQQGYNQAMQDFMEKAKEFFVENHTGMFTRFKNYMQDESEN